MRTRDFLAWSLITASVLTWCSNTPNTSNENTEAVKDSITLIEDSIDREIIKVLDYKKKTHNYNAWKTRYRKMDLLSDNNEEEYRYTEAKDSTSRSTEEIIRMREAWNADYDEMVKYKEKNQDYLYDRNDIWSFIIPEAEWSDWVLNEQDEDEERSPFSSRK